MTKIPSIEDGVAEFDIRKVLPFTMGYAQRHPHEMESTVADKINAEVNYAITQAIAEERKRVMEEIEKQIAIHNQLEEEWTGISLAYILKKTINPHAERKEELQIILSSLNK